MNDLSKWIELVVPVRNEACAIADVLYAVRCVPELSYVHIVVVDDGSDDHTPAVLATIAAMDTLVHYLHIDRANKDVALWTGAQRCSAHWIVCMDGDGQYDPGDIPGLRLQERSERCGAVWGVRQCRRDTRWRRMQSVNGALIKQRMMGTLAARDPGCGLFAVRRTVFASIANAIPNPCGQVHCHIPELAQAWGYHVDENAVKHYPRTAGKAKFGAANRIVSGYRSLLQARRASLAIMRACANGSALQHGVAIAHTAMHAHDA